MDWSEILADLGPYAIPAAMVAWFVRSLRERELVWGKDHRRVLKQLDKASEEAKQTAAEQLQSAREERADHREQINRLQDALAERERETDS